MSTSKNRKIVQDAINSITPDLTEGRNTFVLEGGVEVVVNVPRPATEEDPEDWWESSEEYWEDSGC